MLKSERTGSVLFLRNLLNNPRVPFLCLLIFFFLSCSSGINKTEGNVEAKGGSAEWLDRIDALYPAQLYITGLGMGKTKQDADNNAFRSISKSIKLHVKSEETSSEHYRQYSNEEDVSSFEYDDNLRVESETILENAVIEKHSFDSSKNMYYSLAVMRKRKYAKILRSRIMESRESAEKLISRIRIEDSPVIKLGLMYKLQSQSSSQRRNYDILKVVSEDFSVYRPEPDEVAVGNMIEKFLHENFAISIQIEGELSTEITMVLKERFTEKGYYVVSGDGRIPNIILRGSTSLRENSGREGRLMTVHWSLDLNFIEKSSGNIIFSEAVSGRQIQPSYELARERIMYHIRKEHADRIIEGFRKKLSGAALE